MNAMLTPDRSLHARLPSDEPWLDPDRPALDPLADEPLADDDLPADFDLGDFGLDDEEAFPERGDFWCDDEPREN